MTLNINFSPQVEAQLFDIARQRGITPAELVTELITGDLPHLQPVNKISERNAAVIALLQSWRDEDATDDPEDIRQAEEELTEFKHSINSNRADAGEHPVYR